MLLLHRYTPESQKVWDEFVRNSKNGTFLFERGYMDYHQDRFVDHSLMLYDESGKLLALLPANVVVVPAYEASTQTKPHKSLYSHQGLTYGGFILHKRVHATQVMELFEYTINYLREEGFTEWYYKPMPTIYHRLPSEEDEYALFRFNATQVVCNLSCTLPLFAPENVRLTADASRRHRRKLCEEAGVRLIEGGVQMPADEVLRLFWPIMEQNMMSRYGASPVHTLDEMLLLQRRFPRNIRCYLVECQGEYLAGEVLFVSQQVAHAQYGHATPEGRNRGALDFLYLSLIDQFIQNEPAIRYFDFGTSNEQGGRYLNETLIAQKEGFGGRGIAYKTFQLTI